MKIKHSSSLDSAGPNRNKRCGQWSLHGEAEEERKNHRYARLGCKRWSCPQCGPRKARRLRQAITKQAVEKDLTRLVTLTLNPSVCTSDESVAYIRGCWNKFRIYLKRRYKTSISFISILELQKTGYAHLHILVDRYIPQAWLSDAWQAVGGGRIVDIRQVDLHRVAFYLSKYLTKDLEETKLKRGARRYTTSRDIVLFVRQTSGKWALIKAPLEFLYALVRGITDSEKYDKQGVLEWFEVAEPLGVIRI